MGIKNGAITAVRIPKILVLKDVLRENTGASMIELDSESFYPFVVPCMG